MRGLRLAAALAIACAAGLLVAGSAVAAAPVTASPPTIEGKPFVGETLSTGNGLWRNSPTSFTYQWLRCDAKGNNCSNIVGAVQRTYTLTSADAGHTVVVLVTAINASGSATANSHPSAVITPAAPPPAVTPTIVGKPIVGTQLVADPGQGAAAATQKYAFQWERCDRNGAGCVNVAGATGQTYGVLKADVGHTIRVQVKATNPYGSTTSESKATGVVTEQATAPPAVTTTFTASTRTTTCCQSVKLSGTVSTGKAGEPITVLERQADDVIDTTAATTVTGSGGAWSVSVVPTIGTTYTAQTSTSKAPPIAIGVHPRLGLGVSGNTFSAKVTARDSFGGRVAYFQVATRPGGAWKTRALVVINLQSVARFHVALLRGHTYYVRIYLPKVQAGPGYLDGTSHTRRVGGAG
jgi:hypothetical protein